MYTLFKGIGDFMSFVMDQEKIERQRMRTLRRARRYIRENRGALARLLNTYSKVVELDASRRFWIET